MAVLFLLRNGSLQIRHLYPSTSSPFLEWWIRISSNCEEWWVKGSFTVFFPCCPLLPSWLPWSSISAPAHPLMYIYLISLKIDIFKLQLNTLPHVKSHRCECQWYETSVSTLRVVGSYYQLPRKLLRHGSRTLIVTQFWFSKVVGRGNWEWQRSNDSQHCTPH